MDKGIQISRWFFIPLMIVRSGEILCDYRWFFTSSLMELGVGSPILLGLGGGGGGFLLFFFLFFFSLAELRNTMACFLFGCGG